MSENTDLKELNKTLEELKKLEEESLKYVKERDQQFKEQREKEFKRDNEFLELRKTSEERSKKRFEWEESTRKHNELIMEYYNEFERNRNLFYEDIKNKVINLIQKENQKIKIKDFSLKVLANNNLEFIINDEKHYARMKSGFTIIIKQIYCFMKMGYEFD